MNKEELRKKTHLGDMAPVVRRPEELLERILKDAETLGKEVDKILSLINVVVGYDREVAMVLIPNIAAVGLSYVELFESDAEKIMKENFDKWLEIHRDYLKKHNIK